MKFLIYLAAVALAAARPGEEQYDSRYDSFNVDELIENARLLMAYSHCFLGDGNCTPDGKNFKKWLPDAVKSNCDKCTDKQKVMAAKVIKAMMTKLPAEWEQLVGVHDPEKKRTDDLKTFLQQYAP